ncbi:MAG: hypothetical protein OCD01_08445 [Fibrobacterales bacterium]
MHSIAYEDLIVGDSVSADIVTEDGQVVLPAGSEISSNSLIALTKRGNPPLQSRFPFSSKNRNETEITTQSNHPPLKLSESVIALQKKEFVTGDDEIHDLWAEIDEPPFETEISFGVLSNRDQKYKLGIKHIYISVIEDVKTLYASIYTGQRVDPHLCCDRISGVLLKILKKDKHILLECCNLGYPSKLSLFGYTVNTAIVALINGVSLQYKETQLKQLIQCALLHNIGIYFLNNNYANIVQAKKEIDPIAFQALPALSANILERYQDLARVVPIAAYQACEREDGSGYPKGKNGSSLHPFSKILAIAHEYIHSRLDSVENVHPFYRMRAIIEGAAKNKFEKEYVNKLIGYTSLFPIGSLVKLSSNEIARVIGANIESPSLPVIAIISKPFGKPLEDGVIKTIDTRECRTYKISAIETEYKISINDMIGF